jgi:cellulose synthase/poly-beta-1,6-N-acetylglucosamine synthase-like glycosyltransferase
VTRAAVLAIAVLSARELAGVPAAPPSPAVAQRPAAEVDTTVPLVAGATVMVRAGEDLQAALDLARPGDVLLLQAGATFTGPFVLPEKRDAGPTAWITVRSSSPDSALPPGTRIDPQKAPRLARLEAASGSAIVAAARAHHFRLVGLELRPAPGTFLHQVVDLGGAASAAEDLPHHIVLDRCYVHGDPARGGRRGVALNSATSAVVDSYLSDFKELGADSQAIAGWNGPGPFKIANNYLEAAGENVMFGGAAPTISGLVPSDIEIRGNHLAKPLAWRSGDPAFQGASWTVKNLFELKNARRVLVDGNLMERNWAQSQDGFAVLFTARDEAGAAPWAVVEDVVFSNNTVRHAGSGVNIIGHGGTTAVTRRIVIRNNLFDDLSGESWGGGGRLLQLVEGADDIVFDHNTALQTGSLVVADGAPHARFVFTNNIARHNAYGVIGSGTGTGLPTLAAFFPGARFAGNVLAGGQAAMYPPGNFFAPSLEAIGFDRAAGDYRLGAESIYRRRSTDGTDPGVDVDEMRAVAAAPSAGFALPFASGPTGADRASRLWNRLRARTVGRSWPRLVFWASAALLGYPYVAYPLLIWLLAMMRGRTPRTGAVPSVTVIVVAHDEEERVEERIENVLAQDYPRELLEVVLASDGSTDRTAERARALGVEVRSFDRRRGKPSVLNEVIPQARGEVVVLADVRQRFDPGTVRALVSCFADPRVGAVSGELVLAPPPGVHAVGEGVGLYWRYEKAIRRHESMVDSTVGATGAIYAIRRELFEPLPADTVLDDVLIPLRIVGRGYRVLFEPRAIAYDAAAFGARQEFRRKVRTLAGNFQLFFRHPWVLVPSRNRLWFQTLSHKALRLLTPLLLAGAFAANVLLARTPLFRFLLAGQALFYAAALAGALLGTGRRRLPLLSVPYVICLLSWATVVGFFRFATGRQRVTWERASA